MNEARMTHERETELALLASEGCDISRDALVEANMGLVHSIAMSYSGKGIEFDDLVQEGSIGLIKAVDKFDPSKGTRLSTYAYMKIKRQIQLSFTDLSNTVKVPEYMSNNLIKINSAYMELSHKFGREPSRVEIAEHLDITERAVELALLSITDTVSADSPISSGSDEDEIRLEDTLGDNSKFSRNDLTELADKELVETLLDELIPRDQDIIRMRWNLDGEGERTYDEIGFVLGFVSETIRQAERRAIYAMRNALEGLV